MWEVYLLFVMILARVIVSIPTILFVWLLFGSLNKSTKQLLKDVNK